MSTQSPGRGSSPWSASLSPDLLPLETFLRSGVGSIPVVLVPQDGGAIKMTNPGAVRAALQSATSHYESISEVRQFGRGGILCRSPDLDCVRELLKASSFASLQVSSFIPSHLACTKGIVRGVDSSLSPAETLELLSAAGVVAVHRCSRDVNNMRVPTESMIATFVGTSCPSEIKAWHLIFRVDTLSSRPVQCNNCWRYGHSAGGCKSNLRCCNCGDGHATSTCTEQNEKWCLCGGAHSANYSNCPSRAQEIQILEIIDRKRCSRRDAITQLKERAHGYAGVTARQGVMLDSMLSQAIAAAVEASMSKMAERIVASVSECLTNVLATQLTHAVQAGVERKLLDAQLGFTLSYISGGMKDRWILPGLVFADDVVLMAETHAELQALINVCAEAMAPLGLNFNAKINLLDITHKECLERGQRAVGRLAPWCHGRVTNEAVQGVLGWSTFEARGARSKIAYDGRLRLMHKDRWARRVFYCVSQNCLRITWVERLQYVRRKFGFFSNEVQAGSARKWAKAVEAQVRAQEREAWRAATEGKSTLEVHRAAKQDICVESLYDNSVGSRPLFEARAGAMPTLTYRKRFDTTV
ncbi:uncharacterized protein LOC144114149 [Amblyomma americanum]